MDRAYYETDEFLDLRDAWYKRLADEGFQDIEIMDEITRQPGSLLRGPSPGDLTRSERRVAYVLGSQDYYRLAAQHVWTLPRGPERHAVQLHADGLTDREVTETICTIYQEAQPKDVRRWINRARRAVRKSAREGTAE